MHSVPNRQIFTARLSFKRWMCTVLCAAHIQGRLLLHSVMCSGGWKHWRVHPIKRLPLLCVWFWVTMGTMEMGWQWEPLVTTGWKQWIPVPTRESFLIHWDSSKREKKERRENWDSLKVIFFSFVKKRNLSVSVLFWDPELAYSHRTINKQKDFVPNVLSLNSQDLKAKVFVFTDNTDIPHYSTRAVPSTQKPFKNMPLHSNASHESATTKNLCFLLCKGTDHLHVLHFLRAIKIPCEGKGKQRGQERSDERKSTGFLCVCVCYRTSTDRLERRYNSEKATAPLDCAAVTTSDQLVLFHCNQAIHDCCPPSPCRLWPMLIYI